MASDPLPGHNEQQQQQPAPDLLTLALQALHKWSLGPAQGPAKSEIKIESEPPQAGPTSVPIGAEEQGHDLPLPSTLEAVGENDPIAHYRKQIEVFDADREAPVGKGIRLLLLTTGYVAPVCCAALLGWEFGELFGKGDLFFSAALHVLSLSAELIIAGLALATAWSLKRLGSDRHMLPRAVLCGALFLVASIGSATALWWALSSSPIPPIVLAFRVIVPVLIEVGGMAIVATLDFQSLEAFLAALHRRAEAIQRLSEAELRLKAAEQEAANRQREYEEYRQMRARNEEVLLKMLEIQSRGALAALERQVRVIEQPEQPPALPPAAPPREEKDSFAPWRKQLLNGHTGHQARR